ncbi:MAG: putative metal-binding motif-containing protein [Myxococcaceae bacterium]|nr:putative metal-binding motif-containing protein [Myxococcaceae bacterium]
MALLGCAVVIAASGCRAEKVRDPDAGPVQLPRENCIDADGDGQPGTGECDRVVGRDCDDERSDVFNGAPEVCDGVDNNCDGRIDEGLPSASYYLDRDHDGIGSADKVGEGCGPAPLGSVTQTGDCADDDDKRRPGVAEECNGLDDDCDGNVDNGLPFADFYEDKDSDGYGDAMGTPLSSCYSQVAGRVTNKADCNDVLANVRPGATEMCNKVDDNCDGQVDNGINFQNYYPDVDGDGFGAKNAPPESSCAAVSGKVTNNSDCNDNAASVKPGAPEACNGVDDNCDGRIDDGLTFTNYYVDADGDGYGKSGSAAMSACSAIAGRSTNANDCNDMNPMVKPQAPETCNGVDDNCDGQADNGLTFTNYYVDADGDGFGAGPAQAACAPVSGKVTNNSDCNDSNAAVKPGAAEVCNGVDDNCTGGIDEGLVIKAYYTDSDGDGFGASGATAQNSCAAVPGKVVDHTDCDDTKPMVKPGAAEACNGIDDNCDGQVDNGTVTQNYYVDADNDGYGKAGSTPQVSCIPVAGHVTNADDCDDTKNTVKPGAAELCNGSDDNCNGSTDEGLTFQSYYTDADSDGFGSGLATAQVSCAQVSGKVTNNTDCNDGNAAVKPNAAEVCNGADDNCAGGADEGNPGGGAACVTGQLGICSAGTRVCQGGVLNCARAQNPTTESCNGLDDDCNGATDEPWPTKGQSCSVGQGVCSRTGTWGCALNGQSLACSASAGSPTAAACDGLDNDCDGIVDEPYFASTTGLNTTVPWTDIEVEPWYFTANGCAGGVNGTGTDALAGGGMALAGGTGGIYFQKLDTAGAAVGDPVAGASSLQYNDVDLAQAGDAFVMAGIYRTASSATGVEIDLYVMDAATGAKRTQLWSQFNTGNAIDSLRVVRGNGKRVVVLWREVGVGLRGARIEPMYSSATNSWSITGPGGLPVASQLWLSNPLVPEGIGADSTHIDWTTSQTCVSASVLRTIGVAHVESATEIDIDTALEDASSPVALGSITATAPSFLAEPDLTFFKSSGADHFFSAFVLKDPNNLNADLDYWLSTSPNTVSFAYLAYANQNGVNSIVRPRASATASRMVMAALRYEPSASGFARQVMTRSIDFMGNKDPIATQVELSATSGSCGTDSACRGGDKSALTPWASVGKVYYAASGVAPSGTFTSVLTCQ